MPTFLYEVAPNETISGRIKVKGISGATTDLMLNRLFYDQFVFYVPMRILWDGWIDWIMDDDASPADLPRLVCSTIGSVPGDVDKFWMHQSTYEDTAVFYINALPIMAYNLIWNEYFRRNDEDVVDIATNTSLQVAAKRLASYHERLMAFNVAESVAIDTSGSSISVDDLRGRVAEDIHRKRLTALGDQYADLLRAQGVQTTSSIIDRPELIAKKGGEHQYFVQSNAAQTTGENLGEKGGYYRFEDEFNVRRTYCPEHGFIMGVAVNRLESPVGSFQHPSFAKRYRSEYYSPAYASEVRETCNGNGSTDRSTLVARHTGVYPNALHDDVEKWLDYKAGLILHTDHVSTVGGEIDCFMHRRESITGTDTADSMKADVLSPAESQFASAIADELGTKFGAMVTHTSLSKKSPIPHNPLHGPQLMSGI